MHHYRGMKPAVFLAKDATLLERSAHGGPMRLAPGVVDACLLLSGLGYELVVVGSEPAVAWGALPIGALDAVSAHLDDLFLANGFRLAGSYWCPHDPAGSVPDYAFACGCRRPAPGLIRAAAADHDLDLSRSWLVARNSNDIEAGMRAGCSTVWIGDADDEGLERSLADFTARDLLDAAARIMRAREGHSASATQPALDAR
jgi:histidinol-phosphate phosphatase family protein